VVIIGGLMKGIFTPTEAGSIGLFCILVITIAKADIDVAGIKKALNETLMTTVMIVLLIAGSTTLGRFIALTGIPNEVADLLTGLPIHRHLVLCIIFIVYLLGGTFIDDLAFMILATPIFFQPMQSLGYDPIWICIMISLVVGIGSVIPPVAINVFIVHQICKVPVNLVYKGVYPFLVSLILCVVLLFVFPQIVLYLPSVLMK
jgi:C4-dicarboxylate transporter, DctM subunit